MKTNESQTLEFLYQETEIHFLVNPKDKNVMVNATEMAKIFNKRTDHYLQNESTKAFIKALKVPEISGTLGTKIVENRGRNGIYFNRLLALDFAAWLDVEFRVWIILTIDRLLFAKNEKVAIAFKEESNLLAERKRIIEEAKANNNKSVLDLLEIENKLGKTKYQKEKALKEFKSQYKMQL